MGLEHQCGNGPHFPSPTVMLNLIRLLRESMAYSEFPKLQKQPTSFGRVTLDFLSLSVVCEQRLACAERSSMTCALSCMHACCHWHSKLTFGDSAPATRHRCDGA